MLVPQIGQPTLRRAYADAANRILERMREERVAPGTRLPAERQLADELGVSRATVREALAALELMGVLEPAPYEAPGSRVLLEHAHEFKRESFVRGGLELDQ